MKKIDPTNLINMYRSWKEDAQRDIDIKQKYINEIDEKINELEKESIPHPEEIYLYIGCGLTYQNFCSFCAKHFEGGAFCFNTYSKDHYSFYGDASLCPNCAKKYAPYLTRCLIPYINTNRDFFDYVRKEWPDLLGTLCESRVPTIMQILYRHHKLKAFL